MNDVDLSRVEWRKSSFSGPNGNCVEVAMVWRKSSFSGPNGDCVEVATLPDAVAVRDSKDPSGPVLAVTPAEWDAFIRGLAAGEFNRLRGSV